MNTAIAKTNTQYREIKVNDLPDCYFKSILQNMVTDADKATVYVVAKAGLVSDWAAYIGYPDLKDMTEYHRNRTDIQYYCATLRTPSQVLAVGDKLSKETAESIFPEWTYMRYRE